MISRLLKFVLAFTVMTAVISAASLDGAKVRVVDLAWMAGTWTSSNEKEGSSEEIWTAPANGTMIGMFRTTSAGKPPLFEFLILEDDEQGVVKRFKHFRAGYQEVDKEPWTLRATNVSENKVVFQAMTEGKLKSIIYERQGNRMNVTVNTTRDGKPFQIPIVLERAKSK